MLDTIDGMPQLIQAGMGAHISSALLANATARLGALGVVSGVGLRHIIISEIKAGDATAIELAKTFPFRRYVDELLAFAPGGSHHDRPVPMDNLHPRHSALPKRLSAICAYIEVMRARQGHRGKVGINVMWKCALTALPTIYGAMLARVDALLCGAGVPMELPDIVQRIRAGEDLDYQPLTGTGTNATFSIAEDSPADVLKNHPAPHMMPIISNFAFCKRILDVWAQKYHDARPFAFILENHSAGGHNAPPRDKVSFGSRDDIDHYFDNVRELGVPIYVAGAFPSGGMRSDLLSWQSRGAYGIQVGSRFALCNESGMRRDLKEAIMSRAASGTLEVLTSNRLSPTGYPLKYVPLPGTMSDPEIRMQRPPSCNKGYLLQSHLENLPDGTVRETHVCPAMPPAIFVKRGGDPKDIDGRLCLCNALISTAGMETDREKPLVTLGLSGTEVTSPCSAREVVEEILTPEVVARNERALCCSM